MCFFFGSDNAVCVLCIHFVSSLSIVLYFEEHFNLQPQFIEGYQLVLSIERNVRCRNIPNSLSGTNEVDMAANHMTEATKASCLQTLGCKNTCCNITLENRARRSAGFLGKLRGLTRLGNFYAS